MAIKDTASSPQIVHHRLSSNSKSEIARLKWLHYLRSVPVLESDLFYIVFNYLTVMGYHEAAYEFSKESGAMPELSFDTMNKRQLVRDAITENHIDDAIQHINSLEPTILKNNPDIHFKLREQQLIQHILKKDDVGALQFAQDCLAPCVIDHPHLLPKLEDAMTYLAFPDIIHTSTTTNNPSVSVPYQSAEDVDQAILDYFGIQKESVVECMIKHLIWTQTQLLDNVPDISIPLLISPCSTGYISILPSTSRHKKNKVQQNDTWHFGPTSSSSEDTSDRETREDINDEHLSSLNRTIGIWNQDSLSDNEEDLYFNTEQQQRIMISDESSDQDDTQDVEEDHSNETHEDTQLLLFHQNDTCSETD